MVAPGTWKIDPSRSAIAFSVRHMVVSRARGRFTCWSGQLRFDPEIPESSSVEVTVELASVDTADADRDANLRSDLFQVERFPTAAFRSTKVENRGGNRYRVTGDLSLHGLTWPVVLEATWQGGAAFRATAIIERKQFGLEWSKALETGGLLVGEKVDLTLE
ncbi:MAG TPA: YceI family protein, partial [Myxococcales bacterium]|nr:YceI family protein [Myxococcales bacterium]